jgi:hypothetical protein
MSGWVKLHRKLIDSRVFANDGLLKVWVWCLLKASHEKEWFTIKTGRGTAEVDVIPGQFIFGRKTAAKELKMKERTVYDRILKLEKLQNIAIQPNTHYSIVSIINWDTYQDTKDANPTANPTTNQQPTNTYKNDKKYLSRGKSALDFFAPEINGWDKSAVEQIVDGFISMRKSGQITIGVIEAEIKYWEQFSDRVVNQSLKAYAEKRYWEKGKGEKYLRGIMRGKHKAEEKTNSRSLFQRGF